MFNLQEVLQSTRIVSLYANTIVADASERDVGQDDTGVFYMNRDTSESLDIEASVKIAGREYFVSLERAESGPVHLPYVTRSGIASVWMAVLDAMNVQFAFQKPTNAAVELEGYFIESEGADTPAGLMINAITDRLLKAAGYAATAHDEQRELVAA